MARRIIYAWMVCALAAMAQTTTGDGWDGPGQGAVSLTYSFGLMSVPTAPDAAANKTAVVSALRKWAQYVAMNLTEGTNPLSLSDINVGFYAGAHWSPDGQYCGDFGNALAHTFFPGTLRSISGDVHLNASVPWSALGTEFFQTTVLHELGHSLGLLHTANPPSIMYPAPGSGQVFTQGDVEALRLLYAFREGPPIVSPPPPPPGIVFTAAPAEIASGQGALLHWAVGGSVTAIGMNGAAVEDLGTITVYPYLTTAYTITATGPGGTSTATVTVSVKAAPPAPPPSPPVGPAINYFLATPSSIAANFSTQLQWSVSGASKVSIDQGVGVVAAAGSLYLQPAATTTYTLTATGTGSGAVARALTVTVTPPAGFGGRGSTALAITAVTPSSTADMVSTVSGAASGGSAPYTITWRTDRGYMGNAAGNPYSVSAPLEIGPNSVTVTVRDAAGATQAAVVPVTRLAPNGGRGGR